MNVSSSMTVDLFPSEVYFFKYNAYAIASAHAPGTLIRVRNKDKKSKRIRFQKLSGSLKQVDFPKVQKF